MTTKLLIATTNRGKLKEYREMLVGLPFEVMSLEDAGITLDVEETGETFEENAILKAKTYAAMSGMLTLADDSGLEVDALGGEPGVRSARYAGEGATSRQRNELLLRNLAAADDGGRGARFRCVIAVASPSGDWVRTVEGACEGTIAHEMKGETGFGYDPLFIVPEYGAHMAELSMEQKNRISHRGRAVERAKPLLAEAAP